MEMVYYPKNEDTRPKRTYSNKILNQPFGFSVDVKNQTFTVRRSERECKEFYIDFISVFFENGDGSVYDGFLIYDLERVGDERNVFLQVGLRAFNEMFDTSLTMTQYKAMRLYMKENGGGAFYGCFEDGKPVFKIIGDKHENKTFSTMKGAIVAMERESRPFRNLGD